MGKVISYMNAAELGIFCQIELQNNERILISFGRDEDAPDSPGGVKIFMLDQTGTFPTDEIWGSNDLAELIFFFGIKENRAPCEKPFLDCIKDRLINCKSIEEVEKIFGISR